MPAIYQEDVAYIHHVGFGRFATEAAPGLIRIIEQARITKGVLVDLGCGSGIWARVAQRGGFKVLGVDASPAMIGLARKLAPKAEFQCGSLHNVTLPKCDTITAIGEGFNYLESPQSKIQNLRSKIGPPNLTKLFHRLASALCPGGLLIFDVIITGRPRLDKRTWVVGRDWAILTDTREFPKRRRLVRVLTTFRKLRGRNAYRRGHEQHEVHVFQTKAIERELRAAGFTFHKLGRYGKMSLLPRRIAFVCRKTC